MNYPAFLAAAPLAITIACFTPAATAQVQTEDLTILSGDTEPLDNFAETVIIEDGIIYTSRSNRHSPNGIYMFDESTRAPLGTIAPADMVVGDNFGRSFDVDGSLLVVGAADATDGDNLGVAYLFDTTTGTQLHKFVSPDAAPGQLTLFSSSVAVANGIVAIGAAADDDHGIFSGSVYLFDASTGALLNKISPDDLTFGSFFSREMDMDGNYIAITAASDINSDGTQGSVYLYDPTTAELIQKIQPNDVVSGSAFGSSIAIHQNMLLVGARSDDLIVNGGGSAYLFDLPSGDLVTKIIPERPTRNAEFGYIVDIDENTIAIGSPFDARLNGQRGSVFLYRTDTQEKYLDLIKLDGGFESIIGLSVTLTPSKIYCASTAPRSMLIFNTNDCPVDLSGDGVLDFHDISLFLSQAPFPGSISDFNGDELFDFFDITKFIAAYTTGCP